MNFLFWKSQKHKEQENAQIIANWIEQQYLQRRKKEKIVHIYENTKGKVFVVKVHFAQM